MKRPLPLLAMIAALACVQPAHVAHSQASAPAGTRGGLPVVDPANIAQYLIDIGLQKVQTRVFQRQRRQAAAHYRRVVQHAGVTVFRSGGARRALGGQATDACRGAAASTPVCLTGGDRALLAEVYGTIYAHEYAPGIPEAEQDSAAQARMDSLSLDNAQELERIQKDITHLQKQISKLNDEVAAELRQSPGGGAANRQGRLEQLQAALRAKTGIVAALNARADVLRNQHGAMLSLYARQQDARYATRVQRAAQEFVGSTLPPPFVPAARYDGVRSILRFPGLPESKQGN